MSNPSRSCDIVLPAFNEEGSIAATISRLQKLAKNIPGWEFTIICINDGSNDRTAEILSGFSDQITVITHDVNRGYGAALRTGLNQCNGDWVFIVDADATYPIEDLPRLLKEVDAGADMVVGAREGIGIQAKPFHRIARWILRKMAHVLTGVMVPDLNSGMRVFRLRLYREFRGLLPLGFSFTTTLTLAALYSNYRSRYVPIHYADRVGRSSIRPVRDFFAFVMLIIRIASYFEPLRFFLPLAFAVAGVGFVKGAYDFWHLDRIGSLSVIMVLMGVQIAITGILAEVIVRRSASYQEPNRGELGVSQKI